MLFANPEQARKTIESVITMDGATVQVRDRPRLHETTIDLLLENALFHPRAELRDYLRWLIHRIAAAEGIFPASVAPVLHRLGREPRRQSTVPALSMRLQVFDTARAVFRAARAEEAGPLLFELADGELGYEQAEPSAFASGVLAAAVKERYRGPVFLQAGWLRVDAPAWTQDREVELARLRLEIRAGVEAGFFNFHFATAPLIDPLKSTAAERQRPSYKACGELVAFVREVEPAGMECAVGGETGADGGPDAVGTLRAFLNGVVRRAGGLDHVALVVPGPDDYSETVVKELAGIARREYGTGLALRGDLCHLEAQQLEMLTGGHVAELQLATCLDDWLFAEPAFPAGLKAEIDSRAVADGGGQPTDRERRGVITHFERALWDLPETVHDDLQLKVAERLGVLFRTLGVARAAAWARESVPVHDVVPVVARPLQAILDRWDEAERNEGGIRQTSP